MKFYLTTTLPYVNSKPHVGSAEEFVRADVIVRFFRKKLGKDNTFFNVGTDEHGIKVYKKAQEKKLPVKAYVDVCAADWKKFCTDYLISYDSFYRTSDPTHYEKVQKLWTRALENDDIYKKSYSGLYCVGCEAFVTEKELVDGKCPFHNTEPEVVSEENYFFRFTKYKDTLLKFYKETPDFVRPKELLPVLVKHIESIEDVSISRLKSNVPWGIPVPNDPEQVMYVWFDALTNYIFAIDYLVNISRFTEFWPGVQICGTDNLKHQGALWQAMLASFGLPFTKKLLVNGFVVDQEGRKMSKTIGNVINPDDQMKKYNVEAVRLYLVTGGPHENIFAYSEQRLVDLYNDTLADKLGNLLTRVVHLANSKNHNLDSSNASSGVKEHIDSLFNQYTELFETYDVYKAFEIALRITSYGNEYIVQKEPWRKDIKDFEFNEILDSLTYVLEKAIECYEPVIPQSCEKAIKALTSQTKIILFKKLEVKKD